jgi:hypothetical protein
MENRRYPGIICPKIIGHQTHFTTIFVFWANFKARAQAINQANETIEKPNKQKI